MEDYMANVMFESTYKNKAYYIQYHIGKINVNDKLWVSRIKIFRINIMALNHSSKVMPVGYVTCKLVLELAPGFTYSTFNYNYNGIRCYAFWYTWPLGMFIPMTVAFLLIICLIYSHDIY